MLILGINAFHGDSSACIVADGRLVAAAEEERFCRIKHWAGFPLESIKYCLREAGVSIHAVDHIGVNRNPNANLLKKALFAFSRHPSLTMIRDRLRNASKVRDIKSELEIGLHLAARSLRAQLHNVEHHRAHLASTFLVSPFESSAIASVDGFGDFVSTMFGRGAGNHCDVVDEVTFPHSLGLFYLAMTQYLGFPHYGDEYKVMGLAALGEPEYWDAMRQIVLLKPRGGFELQLDYFVHHSEGVSMMWDNGAPIMGTAFSAALSKRFGPPRQPGEPVTRRHENLAASLQAMYEEAFFHVLNRVAELTPQRRLCLAGGCALNSVANGKIAAQTPFEQVYIPPAAADSGGAIGAAYWVWNAVLQQPRSFVMDRADWGPQYGAPDIAEQLDRKSQELAAAGCRIHLVEEEGERCRRTAQAVAAGKVVGWFQGRMEWGARALGHRSIIADPRRAEMKDILNARIKRRELFRPFAPSILAEAVGEYFEQTAPSPFMTMTYKVRSDKRHVIPAPTHVDGTGRLQTVSRDGQPLYWRLIKEFEKLTTIPVVLNTSFNENEPIVCTPEEAINCFLRTKMDVLTIENYMLERDACSPDH